VASGQPYLRVSVPWTRFAFPVGIAPAALGRVGGEPVQLDTQAVLLIQVVQLPGAAAVSALGLPPRRRQAVGAFHAVDVVAPRPPLTTTTSSLWITL